MTKPKKSKESTPFFTRVKTKEESEEESKTYTFIGANTLPDRAKEQLPDGEVLKGEVLSKNVLDKFAGFINDKTKMGGEYGSYRTVSLFHNRVNQRDYTLEEAGYVVPGTAEVKELDDYPGNFGLFVDVEVNEKYNPPAEYPDYNPEKIHYKISKDALGLSVEYQNTPTQEKIVDVSGEKYRYILDSDDFRGFGFARPDLIGNPSAIRIKEISLADTVDNNKTKKDEVKQMAEEDKEKIAALEAEVAALKAKSDEATKAGEDTKVEELNAKVEEVETKMKELKLSQDADAAKIKESLELAFSSLNFKSPAKTKEDPTMAKVKEIYGFVEDNNWAKFKEDSRVQIETNGAKLKEMFTLTGTGYDFENWQTLKVKCRGSSMVVVPSAKTKDVINATDMNEATYYQTNAMFADRYVAGITETFLKEDSLMKVLPKIQHIGGNDKYQWRVWTQYVDVGGSDTLAVNPNTTSVNRTQRDFIKMETRIVEYRDGVEVTDFTQYHSMGAVGDLLGIELERAAQAVTESMNADLFKGKTDATSAWEGFIGLIGVADSTTHATMYGRTRSAANRLLDGTLANTYVSTAEAISSSVIRSGYEKVLTNGSSLGSLAIVIHPTQVRRLFDTEDADIRHPVLTMSAAPASFGFERSIIPYLDGIPMIRDYRCESSAAAKDMFAIVDLSTDKGFNLIVSQPLGARGLAKVGTSEAAYVNFWGCTVYKSPRNVFVHDSLTAT